MVSSTLCPAVDILGSQNVYDRAEGIADHYWPWAVFFLLSSPLNPYIIPLSDSVIVSCQRSATETELDEAANLQLKQSPVLYHTTQIGKRIASFFYRSQRHMIDHSCLTDKSLLQRCYIANDRFLAVILKFLATKHKAALFKYKDELQNQEVQLSVNFFFKVENTGSHLLDHPVYIQSCFFPS